MGLRRPFPCEVKWSHQGDHFSDIGIKAAGNPLAAFWSLFAKLLQCFVSQSILSNHASLRQECKVWIGSYISIVFATSHCYSKRKSSK